jgi:DNA polymerase III epsilon subunit-like protein
MTIFYVSVIGHLSFNDMSYFMVDVEADGPVPGLYSMVSLAAVLVKPGLEEQFYAELRPISDQFDPEALAVPGFTREQTLAFADPGPVVADFQKWVTERSKGRAFFISDNNGFDYMFVCWYLHQFTGNNPFDHSSQNLGSLYKGLVGDMFQNFKHLRQTAYTHNALDDALGNAEALLAIKEQYQLKIALE